MPGNSARTSRKRCDLDRVERMVFFRAGEVAHHQRDAVIVAAARRELRRFVGGKAEPVHAGVDMQRGAAAPARCRAKRVPFVELGAAADHRPQVRVRVSRRGAGQQAVEHVDRRVRRDARARAALRRGCATKNVSQPAFASAPRDLLDAAAVAVGLDHRGALRAARRVRRARASSRRSPRDRSVRMPPASASGGPSCSLSCRHHRARPPGARTSARQSLECRSRQLGPGIARRSEKRVTFGLELQLRPCRSGRGAACR